MYQLFISTFNFKYIFFMHETHFANSNDFSYFDLVLEKNFFVKHYLLKLKKIHILEYVFTS